MLLCKLWNNFSVGLPTLANRFMIILLCQSKSFSVTGFFISCVIQKPLSTPSALSRTGIFWPFKWDHWNKKEDFAAHLKVNYGLHHFDFLLELIPRWQPCTENICLWLSVLMLRFVSPDSSSLVGSGERWHCCSGSPWSGPEAFLPHLWDGHCTSMPQPW